MNTFPYRIHHTLASALLLVVLCLGSARAETPMKPGGETPSQRYVLQLKLSERPIQAEEVPALAAFSGRRLYVTPQMRQGRQWYRLRLGFFATLDEAAAVQRILEPFFPGNWVVKVSAEERRASAETALQGTKPSTENAPKGAASESPESVPDANLAELMESGRDAINQGKYRDAVRIFTRLLEYPENPYSADAQEYLALARERNGQRAHAKAGYEAYLARYPKGAGADRVRQRLLALITATGPAPVKRDRPVEEKKDSGWDAFGGVSQYYRRNTTTDPLGITHLNQSSLSSDLDLTVQSRTDQRNLRARFSGGYLNDLMDDSGNRSRVSSLYLEAARWGNGNLVRFGRQSRSGGGVFGRFDGLTTELRFGKISKLGLVAGFPVRSSVVHGVDTDRYFYALSYDLGTLGNAWDSRLFFVEQMVPSMTDRRAVGAELRYFRPGHSLLILSDYDILYETLNLFMLLGSITLPGDTSLHLTADRRRSPFLTTSNALIGQQATSVDDLLDMGFTDEQVQALALARTAISESYTLGISRPVSDRLQVDANVTMSSLSSTPQTLSPVVVEATEGSDQEFVYSLSFSIRDFLKQGDTALVNLRHSDLQRSDTTTLALNTRHSFTPNFRLNPRVRIDFRQNDTDGSTQWTGAPSMRLNYRVRRHAQLELEVGANWSTRQLTTDTERTSGYFLSAGYRVNF